jgi:ferredoxin
VTFLAVNNIPPWCDHVGCGQEIFSVYEIKLAGIRQVGKFHPFGKCELKIYFCKKTIIAGQECGLCGFCVQSCPVGALWISENEQTTFLLLKPEQCIGCAKCLPVCPDGALGMVTRPADLATTVAVRRSQRARCPRCAAPTVSQAELTAVFARLDADETLRYRLSLCESCKATE